MIIEEIPAALDWVEASGSSVGLVLAGNWRMQKLQEVTATCIAAMPSEKALTTSLLGLPAKEGNFPSDQIEHCDKMRP